MDADRDLADRVDRPGCTAGFSHGILTVTLPKAEEAKPRQITVSASPSVPRRTHSQGSHRHEQGNPDTIPVMVGGPRPGPRRRVAEPGRGRDDRAQEFHTPLIDIHEGPDGLVLEADLPGATEEGVVIQLEDNVLTLHAQVPSPAPEGARMLHEEYRVGRLPPLVHPERRGRRGRISAELKNGVLRLLLPKAEHAKTRRIEIKS